MLLRHRDAKPFTIPGGTTGLLYPSSPRGDQTIASVTLDGVYPERGYSMNDVCTETMVLLEGSCAIEVDGVTHTLGAGDLFLVFPGTKYRMTGRAKTLVCITPAWERNRNQIIPA